MPRLKEETKAKVAYMVKDSVIKKFAKVGGMRVAFDFYDALNEKLGKIIIQACVKAQTEKRSTIRPSDLDE